MSFLTDLRRKWRDRQMATLIREMKALADRVHSMDIVDQAQKKASNLADRQNDSMSWDDRRWLMDTRKKAQEQVLLLDLCLAKVDRARNLNPGEEVPAEFVKCFSQLGDGEERKVDRINDLKRALNSLRNAWAKVLRTISNVKTRVWAMQAFVRFSDLSRLQMGSIIIGGLIVLGAVRMVFFYRAAAGQSVSAYWTLDDLIIQGIATAPVVVLVMLVVELLFRVLSTSKYGAWLIPKQPTLMIIVLLAALLLIVANFGFFRGRAVFVEFTKTRGDEVATVMDKTILRDVHLVGTTSRTAVFLMAIPKTTKVENSQPPGYWSTFWSTFLCAADEFGIDLPWDQCVKPKGNQPYQVLVMDRAQVVCHAKTKNGNICENLPIRPGAEVSQGYLDKRLNELQRRQDKVALKVTGAVGKRIDSIEKHMDRHHDQITNRLPSLGPDSD